MMNHVFAVCLLIELAKKHLSSAKTSAERKSWEAVIRRLEK